MKKKILIIFLVLIISLLFYFLLNTKDKMKDYKTVDNPDISEYTPVLVNTVYSTNETIVAIFLRILYFSFYNDINKKQLATTALKQLYPFLFLVPKHVYMLYLYNKSFRQTQNRLCQEKGLGSHIVSSLHQKLTPHVCLMVYLFHYFL